MTIIVTGGAGFLGSRLIAALLAARAQSLPGLPDFSSIVSLDLAPCPITDPGIRSVTGDIADAALLHEHVRGDVAAVYHLAAVVSGQAEQDFDLGMKINLDGTRILLEACRQLARPTKLIFSSSLAVFGGELPELVTDDHAIVPQTSYGAQKAIGEFLLRDYSRKGFVDGLALRLPTVVVRPGKPNAAASSFASGIIREPLAGQAGNCPVPVSTLLWLTSPQSVLDNLVHALTLDGTALPASRVLNLPGISVTVAEMLDSLRRIGGAERADLVTFDPDERIAKIVSTWPGNFDAGKARALGFGADANFDDIVRQHMRAGGAAQAS